VAFALREKTWQLGCTTGHGPKPRARTMPAWQQECLRDEIAQATRRWGLPTRNATRSQLLCSGREGCWRHRCWQEHTRRRAALGVRADPSARTAGGHGGCTRGQWKRSFESSSMWIASAGRLRDRDQLVGGSPLAPNLAQIQHHAADLNIGLLNGSSVNWVFFMAPPLARPRAPFSQASIGLRIAKQVQSAVVETQ